ncbi:MAG: heavy-metal-associated domain-containing protein [Clostridia bacterium]|nr:heavy-metal-associated domain-containing protein [Clostridia bacterium]
MGNIVIIAALVIVVIAAIVSSSKHFKGEGGCCGGGGCVKSERKKLDGAVVAKKEITIDGMHCKNCKAAVENAINKLDGAVAKVDLKRGVAIVSLDREVSNDVLRGAVIDAGYACLGIREV